MRGIDASLFLSFGITSGSVDGSSSEFIREKQIDFDVKDLKDFDDNIVCLAYDSFGLSTEDYEFVHCVEQSTGIWGRLWRSRQSGKLLHVRPGTSPERKDAWSEAFAAAVAANYPGSVLDLGCGDGGLVRSLRALGVNAVGIDGDQFISAEAELYVEDLTSNLTGNGKSWQRRQWVISIEVAEHIPTERQRFQTRAVLALLHVRNDACRGCGLLAIARTTHVDTCGTLARLIRLSVCACKCYVPMSTMPPLYYSHQG